MKKDIDERDFRNYPSNSSRLKRSNNKERSVMIKYIVRDDSTGKFVHDSSSLAECIQIATQISCDLLHVMYIIRDNGTRRKVRKIVMDHVINLCNC